MKFRMYYLFYPASLLPHKNHSLLCEPEVIKVLDKYGFIVWITVTRAFHSNRDQSAVLNLGRLSHKECLVKMEEANALLFLSSCESLGIPLIEAATLNKPVVCPDLPYSRELLGDSSYFFNFEHFLISFETALRNLSVDLDSGIEKKAILCKAMIPLNDALNFFSTLLD